MNKLELISEFKKELAQMSYFNAAESNWASESGARNRCSANLKKISAQLIDLGLTFDEIKHIRNNGDFLVTEYDFKPNLNKENVNE